MARYTGPKLKLSRRVGSPVDPAGRFGRRPDATRLAPGFPGSGFADWARPAPAAAGVTRPGDVLRREIGHGHQWCHCGAAPVLRAHRPRAHVEKSAP